MKSPRKYTVREKQAAVARILEISPGAAGKELGIRSGTLSCWAHKARQGVPGYALPAPAPAPTPMAEPAPMPEPVSRAAKIARVYTPSEKARALELAAKVGVTGTCQAV